MCGLCGVIGPASAANVADVPGMARAIAHRGPDDMGHWQVAFREPRGDHALGLGHTRLSVIDLSPLGHQPMSTEDGALSIAYNGEVYNFAEIREELRALGARFRSGTDTEVILEAYRAWGPRSFDRFKPWFAASALTTLSVERHGLTGAAGPEAALKQTAVSSGKEISELEGIEKQLAMFDRLPEVEQVKFLEETLEQNSELDKQLPALLKAWGTGNTKKLAAMLNAGLKKTPALYKAMFVDRNAVWTDWIVRRLDS